MQIVGVRLGNVGGVRQFDIELDGTVVFLGDNNIGKSTVLEAIELAIGADRLSRTQAIDEHDFFGGDYRARDGQLGNKIVVEVVIADLDDHLPTKFPGRFREGGFCGDGSLRLIHLGSGLRSWRLA